MSKTHISICHEWAHQSGRNNQARGYAMFYEGDTIYSHGYHFPIARLYTARYEDNATPQDVVLFTHRGYSSSTSKHICYVNRALPSDRTIIKVHNPREIGAEAIVRDYDHSVTMAKEAADKAARARTRGEWRLVEAERWIRNANLINQVFALGRGIVTFETLGHAIDGITERIRVGAERERLAREIRQRDRAEKQTHDRMSWQHGENIGFYGTDENGRAYLRVKGENLETSQGVSVPLTQAIEVFKRMRAVRERGEAISFSGLRFAIGDYRVDSIDADGTLHAGCHVIGLDEGERIAREIGLFVE